MLVICKRTWLQPAQSLNAKKYLLKRLPVLVVFLNNNNLKSSRLFPLDLTPVALMCYFT